MSTIGATVVSRKALGGPPKMPKELLNLGEIELTDRVRGHFKLDLQCEIFDATVKIFDAEDSALRHKSFALALGELARISLEHLAPKEKIRACKWFEKDAHIR